MTLITENDINWVPATVSYYQMQQKPPYEWQEREGITVELLPKPVTAAQYRYYYYGVGKAFSWLDRMVMADEALEQLINAPDTDIYVMRVNGEDAGFAEFVTNTAYTEIQYFGLLPAFTGKGLGKYFIQWVVKKAWSYGAERVQLNTCTLDHPHAIPNYEKAGFMKTHEEVQQRRVLK